MDRSFTLGDVCGKIEMHDEHMEVLYNIPKRISAFDFPRTACPTVKGNQFPPFLVEPR